MQNSVFVIDAERNPLLPTNPARARLLLKKHKATVECMIPFTIKLCRIIENAVGDFSVGIDDGAKHIGVSITNNNTGEIVFVGQIELRQNVKRLVKERSLYRRARRSRNLRHRKPRFNNRIGKKLPPSIRTRKDSIVRFVKDMQRRVVITGAITEEVKFNHARHKWGKLFSLVEIGKKYLQEQLAGLGLKTNTIEGWMTAQRRKAAGITKSHYADAAIIVSKTTDILLPTNIFTILPRRTRRWENNPTKKYIERYGFRHWDIVKASRANKEVIGCVRSLKERVMTLRMAKNDNYAVSYSKSKLFWRPNGLVYLQSK